MNSARVFVTYTHDSAEHRDQVLGLAIFLRENGLDVRLDRWDGYERKDWFEWGQRQVALADFVVVVVSERYKLVGDSEVGSHENRGAQAEVAALREMIQRDRQAWMRRILPVLLPGHTPDEIPFFLQPLTADHYFVADLSIEGADSLLRALTAQPSDVPPAIGERPTMPPRPAPTTWSQRPAPAQERTQNNTVTGGVLYAVQDGDLHIGASASPPSELPEEPSWSRLTDSPQVEWLPERNGSTVLELHLVPVGGVDRIHMRHLAKMPDQLTTLGRSRGLFTNVEAVDAQDSPNSAWAISKTRGNRDSAGLAITRDGQRSAWSALPWDMLGAILDQHDLVRRLSTFMAALTEIDVPIAARYAPALGISAALSVVEGRVEQLPRTSASMNIRLSGKPVRVLVQDSIPARALVDDRAEVAEELTFRLLAEFRAATR